MSVRTIFVFCLVLALPAYFLYVGQVDNSDVNVAKSAGSASEPNPYLQREQERLAQELNSYLLAEPEDYEEQLNQAITMFEQQEYKAADTLLRTTRKDYPDTPDLLAHHAEIIALINGGSFSGEPFELLSRALDIDSRHKPSLWMMGLVNQQMGNHEAALILFELLKREVRSEGSSTEVVEAAMTKSSGFVEKKEVASMTTMPEGESPEVDSPEAVSPAISLYITLEPEMLKIFSPDDTVFVYAQDPDGSSMPLAVTRRTVSDFPTTVTLDDSMAMMPALSLSSSEMVTVGARASRTGTAMALAGDWEVKLFEVPVLTSETIPLNIQYELK